MTEGEIKSCPLCNGQIKAKSIFCYHCKSLLKNDLNDNTTSSTSAINDKDKQENMAIKLKEKAYDFDMLENAKIDINRTNSSEWVDITKITTDEERNQLIKTIDRSVKLINKNRIIEAENILIEAHKLYPYEPLICVNLGAVYFNKGDLEVSQKHYAYGLELAASNPHAINKLSAQKVANKMLKEIDNLKKQQTDNSQKAEYHNTNHSKEIINNLKQFDSLTENSVLCLECGYQGIMGIGKDVLPWIIIVILNLAIFVAFLFIMAIFNAESPIVKLIIALICGFYAKKWLDKKYIHCPNCKSQLKLK